MCYHVTGEWTVLDDYNLSYILMKSYFQLSSLFQIHISVPLSLQVSCLVTGMRDLSASTWRTLRLLIEYEGGRRPAAGEIQVVDVYANSSLQS